MVRAMNGEILPMTAKRWLAPLAALGLAVLALTAPAAAGWFGPDKTDTSDLQLARILGADRSFTATADLSVLDRKGKEIHAGEVGYAVLEGKLRTEIDLTKMKAEGKRAEGAAQMANFGMDRIISIVRPDKNLSWIVYPGLRGYCTMPLAADSAGPTNQPPRITRTELGQETIDGHPCVKWKVTIAEASGKQHEVLVWEATDLDQFPVQTRVEAGDSTMVTKFRDIRMAKPNPNLFEVPPGCKQYQSIQEMMMSGMQQLLQGGAQ